MMLSSLQQLFIIECNHYNDTQVQSTSRIEHYQQHIYKLFDQFIHNVRQSEGHIFNRIFIDVLFNQVLGRRQASDNFVFNPAFICSSLDHEIAILVNMVTYILSVSAKLVASVQFLTYHVDRNIPHPNFCSTGLQEAAQKKVKIRFQNLQGMEDPGH